MHEPATSISFFFATAFQEKKTGGEKTLPKLHRAVCFTHSVTTIEFRELTKVKTLRSSAVRQKKIKSTGPLSGLRPPDT